MKRYMIPVRRKVTHTPASTKHEHIQYMYMYMMYMGNPHEAKIFSLSDECALHRLLPSSWSSTGRAFGLRSGSSGSPFLLLVTMTVGRTVPRTVRTF